MNTVQTNVRVPPGDKPLLRAIAARLRIEPRFRERLPSLIEEDPTPACNGASSGSRSRSIGSSARRTRRAARYRRATPSSRARRMAGRQPERRGAPQRRLRLSPKIASGGAGAA